MFILVSGASSTVRKLREVNPNLGVLMCPAAGNAPPHLGTTWAADNSAFSVFDEASYLRMLEKIRGRDDCLFVTAPDVVGDHAATLKLWTAWNRRIRGFGLIPAFVAQDGCTVARMPEAPAVFIGGTTRYKLGHEAAEIVKEWNLRGRWTHMGRVNTVRRIRYARALGVRSIDGSGFSRFSMTHLPWALRMARQPLLEI